MAQGAVDVFEMIQIYEKNGKLGLVLANGSMSGGGKEGAIRQKIIEDVEFSIPMGHFGEPIDVAYGILYLASDESQYVTGIELTIDGGILAGSEAKPRK